MKSVHTPKPAPKGEDYKNYLQGVAISTALGLTFWGLFQFTEKNEFTYSPSGEERLQIGRVSSEGYSRRADRSIVIYRVKVVSSSPTDRLTERIIYAKRNSCNKARLEIGDTVFLTIIATRERTTITSAHTVDGCVLQDAALLNQMSEAAQFEKTLILLPFASGALFFSAATLLVWIRRKKPQPQ
jgi:hypothetical protein